MESIYKKKKNKKIQNLFLCQKQIQKLKNTILNLIEQPCNTKYQYSKIKQTIKDRNKFNLGQNNKNKVVERREKIKQIDKQDKSLINGSLTTRQQCSCNKLLQKTSKRCNSEPKKSFNSKQTTQQNNVKYKSPQKKCKLIVQAFKTKKKHSIILKNTNNNQKTIKSKQNQDNYIQVKKLSKIAQADDIAEKIPYQTTPLNNYIKKPTKLNKNLSKNCLKKTETTIQQIQTQSYNQTPKYNRHPGLDYSGTIKRKPSSYIILDQNLCNSSISRQQAQINQKNTQSSQFQITDFIQLQETNYLQRDRQLTLDLIKSICNKTSRFMNKQIYPYQYLFKKAQNINDYKNNRKQQPYSDYIIPNKINCHHNRMKLWMDQ